MGLIIEALFFTNLFVFLYNNLLRILNLKFPTPMPTEFIRVGALPEPFEIFLYLFLSAIFVIILRFFHKVYQKQSSIKFKKPFLKYLFLIFLAFLFISNISSFPMARNDYPYQKNPQPQSTYSLFLFSYISISLFLLVEAALLQKLYSKKKWFFFIIATFVAFIIAVITLEPRFPILGHDYSYFYGPIWEVAHGKTLYTEVPSQYGFASILFFAFLYRFHLINVLYLPVFIWFFYTLEYFLCFYIIWKISKNLVISVIGLFSIITLNYFSLYHLPGNIPQTGPMRWLPLILSLFFLLKFKDINSKKFIFLLSLVSFWVLDSGISLILAYCFTLFVLFLKKNITFKNLISSTFTLLLFLSIIFISLNGIGIVLGYRFINILSVFKTFQEYAKAGFGMVPIDPYTYIWVVPLIYFATIIYFFRNKNVYGQGSTLSLQLIFSANLSLFASVYFVGRSHPHNLFHISIFPVLTAFILFGIILRNRSSMIYLLSSLFLFLIFVAYPIYQRQEVMTHMLIDKIKNYRKGSIFQPEWIDMLKKQYKGEINLINNAFPEKQILILSADDTYLFYLTGKENLLNDNSQVTILTKKDVDTSLKKVFSSCPPKIVADCQLLGRCKTTHPFSLSFVIQPILLKRAQEVCNVVYSPTQCTDELCLAVVNKKL